jgi:hypothetical protein
MEELNQPTAWKHEWLGNMNIVELSKYYPLNLYFFSLIYFYFLEERSGQARPRA